MTFHVQTVPFVIVSHNYYIFRGLTECFHISVATAWIKKPTEHIENSTKNAKMDHRRPVTPGEDRQMGPSLAYPYFPACANRKALDQALRLSDINMRFPKIRRRPVYSVPRWL